MWAFRHHVATEYGESRGAAAYLFKPSLPAPAPARACLANRGEHTNSGFVLAATFAPRPET
jgi:hypothetical protein